MLNFNDRENFSKVKLIVSQEVLTQAKKELTEIQKTIKEHEKALKGHDKRMVEIAAEKGMTLTVEEVKGFLKQMGADDEFDDFDDAEADEGAHGLEAEPGR